MAGQTSREEGPGRMSTARPPGPWRPSRREVLVGAGLLGASACTGSSVDVAPRPTSDQRLAARVADEIRLLAARYAATVARHPGLRRALSPLAAEHDAHLRALAALQPAAASPSASSSASAAASAAASSSPSASPSASASGSVPATVAGARTALVDAEREAARRRRGQSLRAGPELARLLASVAACESVHAALLDDS
jgi:hypothetical protein